LVKGLQVGRSTGDVSGQWTKEGSLYLIDGEITVPQDQTLKIEPGVQVIFQGHYKFIIQDTSRIMYGIFEK